MSTPDLQYPECFFFTSLDDKLKPDLKKKANQIKAYNVLKSLRYVQISKRVKNKIPEEKHRTTPMIYQ